MNRPAELKRKRGDNDKPENKVLALIKMRKELAIWIADLKQNAAEEFQLSESLVTKSLKILLGQNLIKEVVNIKAKTKKHYMASEFEPSSDLTGGVWYADGKLDKEFIDILRRASSQIIKKHKVATAESICEFIKKNRIMREGCDCTIEQVREILSSMVLDNEIIEVKSTGLAEFHYIPLGRVCYRTASGLELGKGPVVGAMTSIPCGVCPQINFCTPDGIISPITCEYYKKWLDF